MTLSFSIPITHISMQNPWSELPHAPPYVLPSDQAWIDSHNAERRKHKDAERYVVGGEAFAEPFLGSPEAPVILLSGNPGKFPKLEDASKQFYTGGHPMLTAARRNLLHESLPYPFWTLDPAFHEYPGYAWWYKRVKRLLESPGIDQQTLAQRLLCVEYFPYHTQNMTRFDGLPSQAYSFHLADNAIRRNAVILVMRCRALWERAVPSLVGYLRTVVLNYLNPRISENQCEKTSGAWEMICKAVSN